MSRPLRNLSSRPELVVDETAHRIQDPATGTNVGRMFPPPAANIPAARSTSWGRERVVYSLPLNEGPVQLKAPTVVHDHKNGYLADPDGILIGFPGLWINRMLTARWTEDTRRIAG